MRNVEYVYTTGMTEHAVRERLEASTVGVLAFAHDGESYALPMAHALDGDRLLFRFGETEDSQKIAFADETTMATYTVFEYEDPEDSWSIVVRGTLEQVDVQPDDATINELFPPFRVFDESIDDIRYDVYELRIEELTGRESIEHEKRERIAADDLLQADDEE